MERFRGNLYLGRHRERQVVSIAIRLALNKILSRYQGFICSSLFWKESSINTSRKITYKLGSIILVYKKFDLHSKNFYMLWCPLVLIVLIILCHFVNKIYKMCTKTCPILSDVVFQLRDQC